MKFCESCSAKIDAFPRYSQCGVPTSKGTKFCESCGASFDESMAAKPSEVPLAVPKHAPAPGKIQDTTKPQQPPQSSKVPDPKNPLPTMTIAIIGIVILIVLALGAYVVVLPMLSGTGTSQKSGGSMTGSVIPTASSPSGNVQDSSQSGGSSLCDGNAHPRTYPGTTSPPGSELPG